MKHRLSLLDRLRGWHWEERREVFATSGDGEDIVAPALVRVRNHCGCLLEGN